ncbi:hypothetical protein GGX14DRAFT_557771 [Mycena pura]|uniref:Integrase catalytic domain-containing protein n=1 Tax=Mycena pura TaxID=153505 RepID=A0AAD6YM14_9AGAR|nr:hypothetical protein GGX14DRAFT_557771 [Mycena pura]
MPMTKLPPQEWFHAKVKHYWLFNWNNVQITNEIERDMMKELQLDPEDYSVGHKSVSRARTKLNLLGVRQLKAAGQYDTFKMLVHGIHVSYLHMDARTLVVPLRHERHMKVSESVLYIQPIYQCSAHLGPMFYEFEPDAVWTRKHRSKFVRGRFYSAGPREIVGFDQHDKWRYYGLFLHLGLDPFTGEFLWVKIYWTNQNPVLITSYYLEAMRRDGGIPLLTFSNPGGENNGIANVQSTIRQRLNPNLVGTVQHMWFFDKMNIKSEIGWSIIRQNFAPGFEALMEKGETMGYIDFKMPTLVETYACCKGNSTA